MQNDGALLPSHEYTAPDMKRSIWPIALLTFKEGLRYRVLYGVLTFAILFMLFTVLISGLFMRDIQKIILDLSLSAVSLAGLLVPFFLAITLLSRDIEQQTAFTILARPIARSHYILGKYLGLSLLTCLIVAILTGCTFCTVQGAQFIYPGFFSALKPASILISCLMSLVGILVLNGCVFLWCSLTTSSFLATLLTFATYIIGQTSEDLVRFMSLQTPGVEVSALTQKTVKVALYIFPNLAAFDFKYQAAYGLAIPSQEILLLLLYGAAYSAVMLLLTIQIFSRRDLS